MKLPKKFKQNWIEALRSGEYKQGRHTLFSKGIENDKYCCLGVAAHVLGIPKSVYRRYGCLSGLYIKSRSEHKNKIPKVFQKDSVMQNTLVKMNDNQNKSFKQIANYI